MAKRPRIGVTGNGRRWAPGWWSSALALWIVGATPVRISVRHDPGPEPLDALIIGGGNDIGPEHYGGDVGNKVRIDNARDELEIRWIELAFANKWPLMGICRGAQLINVVLGGSLHQDIRAMRHHTRNRPGLLATKQVELAEGSLVARICGCQHIKVNSLHHQAVDRPGRSVDLVGYDRDGIVQAIEGRAKEMFVGVQWHPEYLAYLPAHMALFRWLVRSAGQDKD